MVETKTYETHDNGGRPFKVVVSGNNVNVFREDCDGYDYDDNTNKYDNNPSFTFEPTQIFIGKSSYNRMTAFSGGHGSEFDGNSILLKIKDRTYVYIGCCIFSFDAIDEIVEYQSPVGNNDVPYPYAIDATGRYYLLIENVIIMNGVSGMNEYDNPYDYYYDYQYITTCNKKRKPKVNFGIKDYYLGNEKYMMRYTPYPEKNYDRLIKDYGKMSIVKNDNTNQILDKETYVDFIKQVGERLLFHQIKNKTEIS